jgi:hypothetical protein
MSAAAQLLVLSYVQAAELLEARRGGRLAVAVSPDLGLTRADVTLGPDGVTFLGRRQVSWSNVEKIAATRNTCFALGDHGPQPIQTFSQRTGRFCSLMPTSLAPTLLVAGFPMHRTKDTDPYHDTLSKIETLAPVVGRVLDTATGLGYTAIEAARTASHVVTIELDPAVLGIAHVNPWSQQLFSDHRITQVVGDSSRVVKALRDGAFSRIVHDPPTFSLAGDLYSGEFYRQLFRLLTRGGRMFHYIGDPESALGRRVTRGAIRRLHEAGFARVRAVPQAFGVVAAKS